MQNIHPSIINNVRCIDTTTEKFVPICTQDAITPLLSSGWQITSQKIGKAKPERQQFTKHSLLLSHPDIQPIDGHRAEILLVNRNDGGSSFKLMGGLYRFACANGLVVGSTLAAATVRHVGNVDSIRHKITTAVELLTQSFPRIGETVKEWQSRQLNETERHTFAAVACVARFGSVHHERSLGLVENIRRQEDASNDLWTTFNRIQENCIAGGRVTPRQSIRAIRSIQRSVDINRTLWDAAAATNAGRIGEVYERCVIKHEPLSDVLNVISAN